MARLRKKVIAALACVALVTPLAGCGLGTGAGYVPDAEVEGELAGIDLNGAEISVGSKEFTEQLVVGSLASIILKSAGANVEALVGTPGSTTVRQSMLKGETDVLLDYTGTAWITYMGNDNPLPSEEEQYEVVRDADEANGVTWLPYSRLNNTYTLAIREDEAEALGVETLSDLSDVPEQMRTYCVETEFMSRNDGFMPMLEAYGLPSSDSANVSQLNAGAIYSATADGVCNFGEVFTTDGASTA